MHALYVQILSHKHVTLVLYDLLMQVGMKVLFLLLCCLFVLALGYVVLIFLMDMDPCVSLGVNPLNFLDANKSLGNRILFS